MPRRARHIPPSGIFHIIARSNNKVQIVENERDVTTLKYRIKKYFSKTNGLIHHYCIMSTHFHILASFSNTDYLAKAMQSLLVSYRTYFQKYYQFSGNLWHKRFKSIPIKTDQHLIQCGRYIELNPVYAFIVEDPGYYQWSSYNHYASGIDDELVTTSPYMEFNHMTREGRLQYRNYVLDGSTLDYQIQKNRFEKQ